jgi:hypothetical protein
LPGAAFWNFAYRRMIFFVCQSVHTKTAQQLDRRYYREQCFDWIRSDQIKQIKSNQNRSDQIRSSMSSSLSDTLKKTITLRFVRRDFNQIIVIIAEISLRQMQRMRFNWTHFDEMIAFVLIIEHKSRKLNQFHEIELLKYLKQRSHAYLNEMCWFV